MNRDKGSLDDKVIITIEGFQLPHWDFAENGVVENLLPW